MKRGNLSIRRLFLVVALLILCAESSPAQPAWAYSHVSYDPEYDWISGISVMYTDYGTQYYYGATMQIVLTGTDGSYQSHYCVLPSWCEYGGYSWVGVVTPPTPGANYSVTSYHWVEIYYNYYQIDGGCTWDCYNWYDAYGYTSDLCSPACRIDPLCYCVEKVEDGRNRYWYPPYILILSVLAAQYLGESNDAIQNPVPILEVLDDFAMVAPGGIVNTTVGSASVPPQMASADRAACRPPADRRCHLENERRV